MIQLDLTADEQQIIADVLENYVSDLRMEIANTDRKDVRDGLKARKRTVRKVLDAMQPKAPSE